MVDKEFLFLHKKHEFFNMHTRVMGKCISLCFYYIVFSSCSMYLQTVLLWYTEKSKLQTKNIYYLLSKGDQSSSKHYVRCTYLKFWPMKTFSDNYKSITVWFLYKIIDFHRVHSTSKKMCLPPLTKLLS